MTFLSDIGQLPRKPAAYSFTIIQLERKRCFPVEGQLKAVYMQEYETELRLRFLASQLYAANNVGTWCFWQQDGVRNHASACLYENEFLAFLELGGCLRFMEQKEEGYERPVMLSDSLGISWIGEHTYGETGKEFLIIIGPVFMSSTPMKYIENALSKKVYSVQTQQQMKRTLMEIPVVSAPEIVQYGKMLHYTITNARILPSDFLYQNEMAPVPDERSQDDQIHGYAADRLQRGEKMILQAVREGNLRYQDVMEESLAFYHGFLSDTGDPLRDGKYSAAIFTALCARAAIDGGLSPKAAAEAETRYYSEIEESASVSALKSVMNRMLDEYVKRVAACRENPALSKSIRACCDYIKANVLRDLTADEIASEMGYTTYYFTRKFSKETGIKVTDYIKQAKIEYAKVALATSNRNIQEISDALHFGNQSYFSKVFCGIVGMTPAAYRNQSQTLRIVH